MAAPSTFLLKSSVAASLCLLATLMLASSSAAAPQLQPSAGAAAVDAPVWSPRRALRVVIDSAYTYHWGTGKASSTVTLVPTSNLVEKAKAEAEKAAEEKAAKEKEEDAPAEETKEETAEETEKEAPSKGGEAKTEVAVGVPLTELKVDKSAPTVAWESKESTTTTLGSTDVTVAKEAQVELGKH